MSAVTAPATTRRHELRNALVGTAIALTLIDAAGTVAAVRLLGAVELNPLLASTLPVIGIDVAMLLRALAGVGLVIVLDRLARHPRNRTGFVGLGIAVSLLLAVTAWNTYQFGLWATYLA